MWRGLRKQLAPRQVLEIILNHSRRMLMLNKNLLNLSVILMCIGFVMGCSLFNKEFATEKANKIMVKSRPHLQKRDKLATKADNSIKKLFGDKRENTKNI